MTKPLWIAALLAGFFVSAPVPNGTEAVAKLFGGAGGNAPVISLPTFQLVSANSGTLDFQAAQEFVEGAVPGGCGSLVTNALSSQIIGKRNWNDGSCKQVITAGTYASTANVPATISYASGTPPSGTALSCANITTANPSASVTANGSTITLASLLASPTRTWIAGIEAIECHYETTISAANVFVRFEVRLWKDGKCWIRVIVDYGTAENESSATTLSFTPVISIGGSNVYAPGSNVSLAPGAGYSAEGWAIGSASGVMPIPDMHYLESTKLVSKYFNDTPPSAALNGLVQTYTQFGNANLSTSMGDTGPQNQIGILGLSDALEITSLGDSRAYHAMVADCQSYRSYGINWRGSADGYKPVRPSQYPTSGSGTDSYTAGSLTYELNHAGSACYLDYLITGDYDALEMMELQSAAIYLATQPYGNGTSRKFDRQTRGFAWSYRTVGQLAAIGPTSDLVTADYTTLLENSVSFYLGVAQTPSINTLGIYYVYEIGGVCGGYLPQTPDGLDITLTGTFANGSPTVTAISPNTTGLTAGQGTCDGGGFISLTGAAIQSVDSASQITLNENSSGAGTAHSFIVGQNQAMGFFQENFVGQVFGYLTEIEALPSANISSLTSLAQDMLQFVVGSLGPGTTGTYCFNYASVYAAQVEATYTQDLTKLMNWGQVWTANYGATACGNTLQGTSGGDPATGSTSYWANLTPAISEAVDLGVSGAAAAYARLTGASNYSTFRNATSPNDFASYPIFGMNPR